MKYKLAIFDFDGTLSDSFPFFLSTVDTLAEKFKFKKLETSEIETLRSEGARKIMSHAGLPLWKAPFVGKSFKQMMANSIDQIRLFDGVPDMLHQLSDNGILLSLVTSNSYENACKILGGQNMQLFTHAQCGTSLFGKRASLRKVLRKTGVGHREAIYVGDEIRDLEAAQAEDIPFGAVAWGYTKMDALVKHSPAECFNAVRDIVQKIVT